MANISHRLGAEEILLKAMNYAAEKHRNQRRKGDDSPYINHPVRVAYILTSVGNVNNINTIAAALLHDTIEDTDATMDDLRQIFGAAIANIVSEVTDDKSLPKRARKEQQILYAAEKSGPAKLVKIADKLDNLRDLQCVSPKGWSEERIKGYYAWSLAVVKQTTSIGCVNKWIEAELNSLFVKVLGTDRLSIKVEGMLDAYLELMDEATD